MPDRYAFRQPGFKFTDWADGAKREGVMRRNTYVCVEGCLSLRNHLDLKRVLLEDRELREEYGNVKMGLAVREVRDVDEYCRGKNEVMFRILEKAGWTGEKLEEIKKANS